LNRFSRLRRTSLAGAAVVLAALGAVGCGSEDPAQRLDRAFDQNPKSADTTVTAQLKLNGGTSPQAQQPITVKFSGPYRQNGPKELPSLDWRITGSFGGTSQAARIVTVPNNAFVEFMGQTYEVGEPTVRQFNQQRPPQQTPSQLGVKPSAWVVDPQDQGDADVAGQDTTHISGRVDLGKLLRDSNRVIQQRGASGGTQGLAPQQIPEDQIRQVEQAVKNSTMDVFVGDDDKIRRVALKADFTLPPEQQAGTGAQGGTFNLTTELANVDGNQQITPPANAQPIQKLLEQLPPGLLGGGQQPKSAR
jgi:hypothetical protein